METETYGTTTQYDALSRPVKLVTPDNGEINYTYDKGGLLKTVSVDNVHSLNTGIVNNIEYEAKGQRQKIQYQNGATATYEYDAFTFRVRNIKTTRVSDSKVLQDLQYWYDLVGNIIVQKDGAMQPVYFDGTVADPQNDYTYDALYRLIQAEGRELAGNNNAPTYNDSSRMGITTIPIAATDRVKAAFGAHSNAYIHTLENPGKYLRNTVAFTNMAYAGIGNNGPESSGEGSKYLGRGYFQLTTKVNYQNFTKAYNKMFGTHANFVEHPEEVATNDKIAVISSLWYFQTFTIPAIQKGLDFGRITRTINAKELGLTERKNLYTKALQTLNK